MTAASHEHVAHDPERCYRPQRLHLYIGVIFVTFCVLMGVTSTIGAYRNVDGSVPHPTRVALACGTFWSGFSLLGAYLIAHYFRARLRLSAYRIVQRGVFRETALELQEVGSVTWRTRPADGSVVARTRAKKVGIELGNYTRTDRAEIIAFVRDTFPEDIQTGWPTYQERWDRPPKPVRPPSRAETVVVALIFLGVAAAFVWCWSARLGVGYLLVGIANVVMAAFYAVGRRRRVAQN